MISGKVRKTTDRHFVTPKLNTTTVDVANKDFGIFDKLFCSSQFLFPKK